MLAKNVHEIQVQFIMTCKIRDMV